MHGHFIATHQLHSPKCSVEGSRRIFLAVEASPSDAGSGCAAPDWSLALADKLR